MDNICEQLIAVKKNTKQKIAFVFLIAFIFITGLLIVFLLLPINYILGILLGVGIIYLGIYLSMNSFYEYEYIFTNGELDIDKIIAKRKRKRLVTVEVKSLSDFGKYENMKNNNPEATIIHAHDGCAENTYYADFKSQKYGLTRLLFSPDERLLNNIKIYIPRNLRNF